MRKTAIYTLVGSFILTATPTCYGRYAAKEQTIVDKTLSNRAGYAQADALDPRWSELPHTDTEFVPRHYKSLNEWKSRRERLRRQILWAAGLRPIPEKTPLRASVFGRIEHDGYTVEKVYFESIPGLFVRGNLYRPRKTSPHSHPGVLNPHGHAATGRLHDDETASYQARCITFARMGCVVFMWDMIEYNDSALILHNTGDCFDTSMVKAACALRQAEGELAEVTVDSAACGDANLLAFMTRANVVLQ